MDKQNKVLEDEYINEQDNFTCIEINDQLTKFIKELTQLSSFDPQK